MTLIPLDTDSCDRPALACPICGHNCIHPIGLECLPPGATGGCLKVDADGVHLNPNTTLSERGVRITLAFACESGCRFAYAFQFHKGQTYVSRHLEHTEIRTIWRD